MRKRTVRGHDRTLSAGWTPRTSFSAASLSLLMTVIACGAPSTDGGATVRLIETFDPERVEGSATVGDVEPTSWEFDGSDSLPEWTSLVGVAGLRTADGTLRGTATPPKAILAVAVPESLPPDDEIYSVEIKIRVSAGENLAINFVAADEIEVGPILGNPIPWPLRTPLRTGEEFQTYTLTKSTAAFEPSFPIARMKHIVLQPTDAAGADFAIESLRLITRSEHLASIPSGIGFQGLADIFRETLVMRAPERTTMQVEVPDDAFLDLALGMIEPGVLRFVVSADSGEGKGELLRRTLTSDNVWQPLRVDLSRFGGRTVDLTLALEGEEGQIGFWGGPAVRGRSLPSARTEPSPALNALAADPKPPQGVILIIADTLRRDHLPFNGYERDNAPVLTKLAAEGAVFRDNISQGVWTKVSVPAILTSLYPTTHGITYYTDRLPATADTLAESFQSAGYATFATSSVPFTGQLSNLHQGVEVLHELASLQDLPQEYSSKTSRSFVDRLLDWLEVHHDAPFFAFLHVFDPHSPFEPFRPWESFYMSPEEKATFDANLEKVRDHIKSPFMQTEGLPTKKELLEAGLKPEDVVPFQKLWYDASIRAMDAEIGRVVEALENWGIADNTLIAFISDHGEEFLEHGRVFHGQTTYGEMANVPLFVHWPAVVPAGVVIEETTQSIDLMPTILELCRLAVPEKVQGQSLLPLIAGGTPSELGWRRRPAFTVRELMEDEKKMLAEGNEAGTIWEGPHTSARALVSDGWKLVHYIEKPEDWPDYELYDHRQDPLNLHDVAAEHPEVVEKLAKTLESWYESAKAAELPPDSAENLSAAELEKLRALGYVH